MSDQAVVDAAKYILHERIREHRYKADAAMARTVYVDATPTPEDAPTVVRVVEDTLKAGIMAEALFHDREAKRFTKALELLDAEE